MNRFLMSAAAVLLGLTINSAVQAGHGGSRSGGQGGSRASNKSSYGRSGSQGGSRVSSRGRNSKVGRQTKYSKNGSRGKNSRYTSRGKNSKYTSHDRYAKHDKHWDHHNKDYGHHGHHDHDGHYDHHDHLYKDWGFNDWTYSSWDDRYGCNVYYDSDCSSYFYFCEPDNCYYPVSYCPYETYSFENCPEIECDAPAPPDTCYPPEPEFCEPVLEDCEPEPVCTDGCKD